MSTQVADFTPSVTLATATTPSEAATKARTIDQIVRAPGVHWVGDGFRVAGYFSVIPDAARRLDPFLLLDYHPTYHYTPTTHRRGVGVHPHRGFETVTLAFQGSVSHHDSTGGGGTIGPGDVQWMTAAAGILHKEYHEAEFSKRGGAMQMAQLWVNLPRAHKMSPPRYQPLSAREMGEVKLAGGMGKVRVIAGNYQGVAGPAQTFSPVHIYDAQLAPGGYAEFVMPANYTMAMLVMEGDVAIGASVSAKANDFVLWHRDGERVRVEATSQAQVLILGGAPIDEPIASYGPFVMNTEQELEQAVRDFQQGKFGHLDD